VLRARPGVNNVQPVLSCVPRRFNRPGVGIAGTAHRLGAASWGTTIPLTLTPDIKRPNSGNALFVFTLP
jgi:hypothetical protein